MKILAAIGSLVTITLTSGCAMLVVDPPGSPALRAVGDPVLCTHAMFAPRVDAGLASVTTIGAVLAIRDSKHEFVPERWSDEAIIGGIIAASVAAYSWNEGRKKVDACRTAKLQYLRRLGSRAPSPN